MTNPNRPVDGRPSDDPAEEASPPETSRLDEWTAPLFTDATLHPSAGLKTQFGQLCTLTRSGFSGDDDDLVFVDGFDDLATPIDNG